MVPVVCSSCDVDPQPGITAGASCPNCQAPLVTVSEPENLIGTVIDDRFEILEQLGQGGMGAVYRAKQRSIGRDVALKVIDRAMESDVVAVKRFLREAQVASSLVHPNTVGVVEFGQTKAGRLYLAMELVRGKTLRDALPGVTLELSRVVRIGVQLCDALEAAHALGIVHRDLKLENVMLLDGPNERDHVKILDFGLARRVLEESRATATGLIAGTPRYLPPEVAYHNAEPAPPQDMYALGVVLGELATGRALWEGPTLEALFAAKLTSTPRLDGVATGLRALIARLLDNDPSRRPRAAETRNALLALEGEPNQKPKPRVHLAGLAETTAPLEPITTGWSPAEAGAGPPAVDFPVAGNGPPDLDPLPSESVPPRSTGQPSVPESAFEPPQPPADLLEIDSDWQREKAARVEQAHRPPLRRSTKMWGVAAALVMVAAVASVVVVIGTTPGKARPPRAPSAQMPVTANTVSIEIRTRPRGAITLDGRKVGSSPLTLHIPKSSRSLQVGADLEGQIMVRTVVPDRDQTVDFAIP
jgi:serine/threonine-protein kinase